MIEATQNGRLCTLDADQALSRFTSRTEPRALSSAVRKYAAHATSCIGREMSQGVVVFGEMVAELWAQKKHDAAIRLEELWNELALTCSFYLCCAYPAKVFRNGSTLVPYTEICAQHSQVVSSFEGLCSPA